MKYPPRKLALLISLIGAGVSPYACARGELRVVGVATEALDTLPAPPAATALDRTRWAPGLVWRMDTTAPHAGPLRTGADDAFGDDRAPGEGSDALAPSASPADERVGDATASADTSSELTRPPPTVDGERKAAPIDESRPRIRDRWRAIVKVFRVKREATAPFAKLDGAITRDTLLPLPAPVADPVRGAALGDATPASSHADRLMNSLAAVLMEDVSAFDPDAVLTTLAERFPAAVADEPVAAPPAEAPSIPRVLRIERREVIVASESSKVLRELEAIRSGERDEVGAIRVEAQPAIVATQAEKVLMTLDEIVSPTGAAEDGAARRERKREAARLKAEARARSAAATAAERVDADLAQSAAPEPPAVERPVARNPLGSTQVAVGEQALDGVRGGFAAEGLKISFGIERAVYVNGALVTTTSLNIADLARAGGGGAGPATIDPGTIALIQNGAGNVVAPATIPSAAIGTVIQNTLNGQKIQNLTVINASVNSLGLLRGLNLQSSLRGAVIDSLRR